MLARIAVCSALLLGCSSPPSASTTTGADDATTKSCDPLAGAPRPIALGKVIGAGKHADGTIYAIDESSGTRAFVSSGTTLQRVVVAGSGQEGDTSYSVSVTDPTPFSLKVELSGGVATRMGVVRGTITGKTFEIGKEGDVLELVPRATLDAMTLKNLPGNAIIEESATTGDGHRLVIVRPEQDWSYEDFRVFYGTDARLVERPVLQVSRGSATNITFMLDGKEADAFLPSTVFAPGASPSMTVGDLTIGLTYASTSASGLAFFCK